MDFPGGRATNGLDDPVPPANNPNGQAAPNGIVNDLSERITSLPYPVPLRGIQIKIRCFEPDSRQVREITIEHDFLPKSGFFSPLLTRLPYCAGCAGGAADRSSIRTMCSNEQYSTRSSIPNASFPGIPNINPRTQYQHEFRMANIERRAVREVDSEWNERRPSEELDEFFGSHRNFSEGNDLENIIAGTTGRTLIK